MFIKSTQNLAILLNAATIDGENYGGYAETYAKQHLRYRIKDIMKIDIATPEGREAIMVKLFNAPDHVRNEILNLGDKTYFALLRYLAEHV